MWRPGTRALDEGETLLGDLMTLEPSPCAKDDVIGTKADAPPSAVTPTTQTPASFILFLSAQAQPQSCCEEWP